jgi:hypothetical protein
LQYPLDAPMAILRILLLDLIDEVSFLGR